MPAVPGHSHARTRTIAALASLILMGLGAVVLAGWTLDIALLKGLGQPITMKANAAIGVFACGAALWLLLDPYPERKPLVRAMAAVAGILGSLTLTEHVAGWNLGIDELLFHEAPGAAATASPGRMGPNSSMSLTLAAIALWCLANGTRRSVVAAQLIGSAIAVFALVPIVGYMYGARQLYAVARITGISAHMGVALLVLSVGILTARPDTGPVAALTSAAAHGVMARRLLVPAILTPLLLGYVRVEGERRGWYDAGLGASMFAVAVLVLLSVTIWRTAVALERSNEARASAEQALSETEQRFRSIADQAPVLIWVEEGGARVWFNRAWYDFTGASPGAFDWRSLVHPDDLPGCEQAWRHAAEQGSGYSHQYRLRRADATYAWVLENAHPRRRGSRGSRDYVGSCVDVTELQRAQAAREALLDLERGAREKAERADRAKDEFIATLSHELRTPLNAILGWVQMLQQGLVPEARRAKATTAIGRNATALARLIEDLLDTSRIAAGRLELMTAALDLSRVARAAVESVMPAAAGRNVEVNLQCEPDLPPVAGDAQRLQQVLLNLLSNAIKFSQEGGRVDVHVGSTDNAVVVRVRDEGDGIDPSFLPYLFDRFTQADSSPARSQGGLGLGLYIAQRLVALHGGKLQAHSDGRGRGATFTMSLPVADAAARSDTAVA